MFVILGERSESKDPASGFAVLAGSFDSAHFVRSAQDDTMGRLALAPDDAMEPLVFASDDTMGRHWCSLRTTQWGAIGVRFGRNNGAPLALAPDDAMGRLAPAEDDTSGAFLI